MSKKLGQHFLNSIHIAKKIVNFANVKDEVVVEIGAGKGMLTRELSKHARIVYAIEIDPRYATKLEEKGFLNVEVINTNFLEFDLNKYNGSVVVGNIPYGITTKIIEKLIEARENFKRAVLTIQKEYGERLLAGPGLPQYSSITCYVNYYFTVVRGFSIQAKFFTPQPSVNSLVIGLIHKKPSFPLKDPRGFFEFIKGIFRYRRKTLKNALLNHFGFIPPDIDTALFSKRPEQLELQDFYKLYNLVKRKIKDDKSIH